MSACQDKGQHGAQAGTRSLGGVPSPGSDAVLWVDSEGVGHAVDVVEIGDDLDGVVDGPVVEARRPQGYQVFFAEIPGGCGHLFRELTQGAGPVLQFRRPPVPRDGVDEGVSRLRVRDSETGFDLGPEVVCVGRQSIMAGVGP